MPASSEATCAPWHACLTPCLARGHFGSRHAFALQPCFLFFAWPPQSTISDGAGHPDKHSACSRLLTLTHPLFPPLDAQGSFDCHPQVGVLCAQRSPSHRCLSWRKVGLHLKTCLSSFQRFGRPVKCSARIVTMIAVMVLMSVRVSSLSFLTFPLLLLLFLLLHLLQDVMMMAYVVVVVVA